MEDRIRALEAEVQALKAQQEVTVPVRPQPASAQEATTSVPGKISGQAPGGSPKYGGAGEAAAKVFNPDISVVGDFLAAAGNGANRSSPSFEMHESEVGFRAVVDPYARADFFLSFGSEGVELEEGYVTFTSLPGALQLRAGKMRAAFGQVNTMHNHVLSWTDRPLVTQNMVAGEEGISDAGLSLSRILPAPKNIFLEGTAQVFRGDVSGLFHAARRSDVSAVGHLRAYRDISESTNLDLGLSYARGHSPDAVGANQIYGLDATLRWKPLRRSIYRSFLARGEFVWARTLAAPGTGSDVMIQPPEKPFGYYISGDYQLARRWYIGGRFDRSDRFTNAQRKDTGGSLILTFRPSEFSLVRGQLRRTHYGENLTANELLFQLQFAIGTHGAHIF